MILPENDYHILKLTDAFYQTYPNPPYREILKKKQRAYNCLLFQSHYNYFICIPYRSEISHKYAFHFSHTARSRKHKSGLDYSKIVIIEKTEYIGMRNSHVGATGVLYLCQINGKLRNLYYEKKSRWFVESSQP